jgi:aspartate/methionine/tyrosine aminotransferase
VTRAISGEQVLLAIWHNITKKEVIEYSPSLADKLARENGCQYSPDEILVTPGSSEVLAAILRRTA